MPRGGRLRNAEDGNEIAHANLAVLQEMKDPEPQRVRNRTKDPVYRNRNHIGPCGFESTGTAAVNLSVRSVTRSTSS